MRTLLLSGIKAFASSQALTGGRGARWAALVILLLAGCAADPSASHDGDLDAAAKAVDVQATSATGIIRGIVVDQVLQPVDRAIVTLEGTTDNRVTEADGTFGFGSLRAGTYFLSTAKDGYTVSRQSVKVAAGVDDPPVVRIQLQALSVAQPSVESSQFNLASHLEACFMVVRCPPSNGPWDGLTDGEPAFGMEVGPGATVIQAELTWDPQTILLENAQVRCGTRARSASLDSVTAVSASPAIIRVNATGDVAGQHAPATSFSCRWELAPGTYPVAVGYNQPIDAIVHTFHHFIPREDWQFGRDGNYPVPEA